MQKAAVVPRVARLSGRGRRRRTPRRTAGRGGWWRSVVRGGDMLSCGICTGERLTRKRLLLFCKGRLRIIVSRRMRRGARSGGRTFPARSWGGVTDVRTPIRCVTSARSLGGLDALVAEPEGDAADIAVACKAVSEQTRPRARHIAAADIEKELRHWRLASHDQPRPHGVGDGLPEGGVALRPLPGRATRRGRALNVTSSSRSPTKSNTRKPAVTQRSSIMWSRMPVRVVGSGASRSGRHSSAGR
jgi:hypothetical protein